MQADTDVMVILSRDNLLCLVPENEQLDCWQLSLITAGTKEFILSMCRGSKMLLFLFFAVQGQSSEDFCKTWIDANMLGGYDSPRTTLS